MTHNLKIAPLFFQEVIDRKKTFEIRKNDRDFSEGDKVILKEFSPEKGYTGNYAQANILYVTDFAQKKGFVVFSIQLVCSGYDYSFTKKKEEKLYV